MLVGVVMMGSSCAKVYHHPDSKRMAQRHKMVAIVPPSVSISAQRKVDPEAMKEQQRTESMNIQREIYSWLLRRKSQGKLSQDIQDPETTNARLERAGYPRTKLTSEELCEVLGVDGILTSNIAMTKPMSEGAAVAIGLITGVWGNTNEVNANLSITDCRGKTLLWNYENTYSGGVGSSANRLVDQMMRRASKKMPYSQK